MTLHTQLATLELEHVATVTWSPMQPWANVVREIKLVLDRIDEDAEVEMQNQVHGPVLFLSFPRGPLIEFHEGGMLAFAHDAAANLVVWSSPKRGHTALGLAMREAEDRGRKHDRELRERADKRKIELITTALAAGGFTAFAMMAAPGIAGVM